jgi:hypothetical protein
MLKAGSKSVIALITVFTLCTCIDPYSPELRGYESLLVVDGHVTDENTSYTVTLSRTMQEHNVIQEMVSDATLFITDESGSETFLHSKDAGIYKTDSISFKGIIGKTYILHIITPEGEKYESDPCQMLPVPDIESIYFSKDQQLINNGSASQEGIRIYLDSKEGPGSKYYRWEFEETWRFKVPSPKKYNYINDSVILPVAEVKQYCWKNRKSNEILIHSVYSGENDHIVKEPIFFIPPDKSDRLLLQYSILVRQYAISKAEYDFWNNMKQVNENGGDIFARQPFTVSSNIHNINDPGERVLGYFQVSSVKEKRKNISFSEIAGLSLPYFNYDCERVEMAPQDYPWPALAPPLTWDDIYIMYTTSGYYFVEPKYFFGTTELDKLVFAKPECADCEKTGTRIKPDFWINLK